MNRMRHVALLIETTSSYGRALLEGVHRYVTEHEPWSMFLELRALDSEPPLWLKGWAGDGIISRTGSRKMARALAKTGVPTVELRATRYQQQFPFVGVDNAALGRLVATHLLERGFRHFGLYGLDIEDYFVERRDVFLETIRDAGFRVDVFHDPRSSGHPPSWEDHQARLVSWLQSLPKPTGLMATTDQLGYWLLDACIRAGITVPEEAAVVGCENDETLCKLASPPLSSVTFDAWRIGYRAAELLETLMNGGTAPEGRLLIPPVGIVTRQSSDIVAIDDPLIAQAVQYMRSAACRGISIDDVLRDVPVARRTLERKMRMLFGRSPREEILRIRIDHARRLLTETSLSLEQIAVRCGFQSTPYFCTQFRQSTRITPARYRREHQ